MFIEIERITTTTYIKDINLIDTNMMGPRHQCFFEIVGFMFTFFLFIMMVLLFFIYQSELIKRRETGPDLKNLKIKQQALKLCTYVINVCNKIFTVYFSKKRIRSYIILYEVSYFKFSSKMTAFLLYKNNEYHMICAYNVKLFNNIYDMIIL